MGIDNRELSEKMQLDPKLTLERATNLARQRETIKQQQTILDGGFKSSQVEVDSIVKGKFRRKKDGSSEKCKYKAKSSENSKVKTPSEKKCQRCLSNFHPKKICPARLSKCRKCSKICHWTQACRSSKLGKLFEIATEEYPESFFLGEEVDLHEIQSNSTKIPWMATVLVNDKKVDFKIDSGADVTVVPYMVLSTFICKQNWSLPIKC